MQNLDLCLPNQIQAVCILSFKMKNRTDKHTEFSSQLNLVCFVFLSNDIKKCVFYGKVQVDMI